MSEVVKSRDMMAGQVGIVVDADDSCERQWCGRVVKNYATGLEILRPDGGRLVHDYTVLLIDEDPDDLVRSDEAAPGRYRIVGPADKDTVARDGGTPHTGKVAIVTRPGYLRRPGSARLFSGLYYLVPISSPKAGTFHATCHDEHSHVETRTRAPVTVSVRPDDEFAHLKRFTTEFVPGVAIECPRVELASVPRKQGQASIRIGHPPANDLQIWRPDTLRKAARFFNELADHLEGK